MCTTKQAQLFIAFFVIIVGAIGGLFGISFASATWNGQPYTPGATLNPECGPTDAGCTIASTTLQSAYNSGNGIVATDGRDISFTLPSTTTNPNLIVNIQGTGTFQIQNNGSTVASITQNGTLTVANAIDNGLTANALVYANGSKQLASGSVTGPLTFASGVLGITQAASSTSGYLSAGDYTTFSNSAVWTKAGTDIINTNTGHVGLGTSSPSANAELSVAGGALVNGGVNTDSLTASVLTAASTTLTGKTTVSGGLTADSVTVASSTLGVITNSTWDGTSVGLAFGGTGATNATTARSNLGLAYATADQLNYYNIVAWGDSLTAGGEDGTGISYPGTLATYTNRIVTNKGIGGQTSAQIGVRQGGVTTTATISGGQIPASGGVTVTFPTGYEPTNSSSYSIPGTISGVYGTVSLSGGIYTFTRAAAGSAVNVTSAQFIPDTGSLNNGTVIIWAGRNDNRAQYLQTESNIAGMVSHLGSNQHYLIMSVLNGEYQGEYLGQTSYNEIIQLNTDLAAAYPGHYLDIRTYLIQHGLSDAGITPTASDTADIASDTVPYSLRTDNVHLNYIGYQLVARQVANYLAANLDPINNSGVVTTSFIPTLLSSASIFGSSTTTTGYFATVGIGTSTPLSKLVVAGGMTVGADYNFAAPTNGLVVEGSTGLGIGKSAPIPNTKLEVIGGASTVFGYDTTTANGTTLFGKTPLISLIGDGTTNDGPNIGLLQLGINNSGTNQSASEVYLGATRAAASGSHAAVGTGDILGRIGFFGDDGTNDRTRAVQIQADVNTAAQATSTGVVPAQLDLATAFNAPIEFFTNYGTNASSYNNTLARMVITGTGLVGVGSSTPWAQLSATGTSTAPALAIQQAGSGPAAVFLGGNVGIGMTSPTTALGINGTASTTNLVISGITNGAAQCLQVDAAGNITGTGSACGTGGGGGTPGGSSGQVQFNNGGVFGGSSGLTWDNTNTKFAVGSTSPWATLSVQAPNNSPLAQFAVGSSTASSFFIQNNGWVSIGVAPGSVAQKLDVNGSVRANGYYGTSLTSGSPSGTLTLVGGLSTGTSPGGEIDLTAAGNANPGVIIFRAGTASTLEPEVARFTNTGNLGIGTTSPGARVDVVGQNNAVINLFSLSSLASGATTTEFTIQNNGNGWMAGTLTQASDQRLKTNVQPLEGSSTLAAIESLQPVSFNWVNSLHGDGLQVGFIAQSVQKIFPNLVSTSSPTALTPDGTLGVNYIGLIAPAIEAIKELAAEVSGFAQSFTSQNVTAQKELCVGDTCVTEAQFKAMVEASRQTSAPAPVSSGSQTESTTTPDTSSEATTTDASTSTPANSDESTTTATSPAPSVDQTSSSGDTSPTPDTTTTTTTTTTATQQAPDSTPVDTSTDSAPADTSTPSS